MSIPFGQLVAEAQKQYAGEGITITPSAHGARLKAVMQDLEAEATGEVLWLTSTADDDSSKTQQLTSTDKAPEGLSKSDWSTIRSAHTSWEHNVLPVEGGWQARNKGQQWTTHFDRRGFTTMPKAAAWQWGLELRSYGFGASQVSVASQPDVKTEGGRLSYQWDGVMQEWFLNDQRGLEHGFVLNTRPVGAASNVPLEVVLGVRGGLQARLSADGQTVHFRNGHGAAVLNYGGLKVWDADGQVLPSHFALGAGGALMVRVEESAARYPLTIDPIAQQAYLKASNTGAGDSFGYSVAVSGDTVVVGAWSENSNATGVNGNQADNSAADAGAAYVFTRSGTTWTQQAYLKASNAEAGDNFGYSVAVAGDTIVVGAWNEDSSATGVNGNQADNSATNAGAAYVFTRSGTTWTQQAYLKPSNAETGDSFGYSVAVAGDTVVVGARYEDSNATSINGNEANNSALASGAAYVFTRSGANWTQQAYLKASNTNAGDWFGWSVALWGDTVVIGARSQAGSGAAYVFTRSGTTWTQQAFLKASIIGSGDEFGISVAVSGDTLVIGASGEDSNATGVNGNQTDNSASFAGAAYVFTRIGTTWTQQAYLKASNTGAGDRFGTSVAVSGDSVVVGAWNEDSNATGINGAQADNSAADAGAAYFFTRSGTTWTQQTYLKASNTGTDDQFGISVAVSGDTVVVGANTEDSSATGVNGDEADNSGIGSGAVYVFANMMPEIELRGNGNPISNGDPLPSVVNHTDFGSTPVVGGSVARTFALINSGTATLNLTGSPRVALSGSGAFSVTSQPGSSTVAAGGGSQTFVITFAPSTAGSHNATVSIANDDSDENPFTFAVAGSALSNNANLSNLVLSSGTLSPAFTSGTTSYTASVPFLATSLAVTPTREQANATITVNGNTVTSGSASAPISLSVGGNAISIVVTAQDGTPKTYTVTVTRAAPGPGDRDFTFDSDGIATTAFDVDHESAQGLAVQSDGKIVAAGYAKVGGTYRFALARYQPNGSLDTSFGTNGKVTTPFPGANAYGRSVAFQSDGKIVVAGYRTTTADDNSDFAVARYTTSGVLDTSFGSGGWFTAAFSINNEYAYDVAVQNDDKIVLVGRAVIYGEGVPRIALARCTSNGIIDGTFDGDGLVITPVGSLDDAAQSIAIQPDGRIVIAGYSKSGVQYDFALVRYTTAGTPDASFDADGILTTTISGSSDDYANDVVFQPDGRIVVAGSTFSGGQGDSVVVRYQANGALDTTFNGTGKAVIPLAPTHDEAYGLAVQRDGRIVVGGYANSSPRNFAVMRLTGAGALDTTFNGTGKVTTPVGSGNAVAHALALQTNGGIVLAGYSSNGTNDDFALVRYLGGPYLPSATTLAATNVLLFSATLNGSANPNGLTTTAWFEYGTTTSYGASATAQNLGSGSSDVAVTANLTSLADNTLYHCRLVVQNADGTVYGNDITFSTPAAVPEIRVFAGANDTAPELTDGQAAAVDFGSTVLGTPVTRSFTVKNVGTVDLHVSGITLPAVYEYVGTAFPWTMVPNSTITIQVRFLANTVHGTFGGTMSLANDDADEGAFDVPVTAAATPSGPVTEQWAQRYIGPANRHDLARAVAVDGSGNVVVTGYSYNGTYSDCYTAKYAAGDGALLWEKRYNGPANRDDLARAVALDGSGNVVVTGDSYNGTSYDYYTAKYAAGDGALLWEKRYNGPANSSDAANAVALDGSGNVVVTGTSRGSGSDNDYYTAKYAAGDGALVWEKRYNGPANNGDYAQAVALDGSGNVVVTGYSRGNGWDYYTAKYAAGDGALLWEKRYNGPGSSDDVAQAVALDGSGNVVVTGYSYNGTNSDYYTAKYAAGDGALLWEKRYNGPANSDDFARAVALDGSGNVVVTGASNSDYYTAKYAAGDGALLWEKRYNGAGNSNDGANAVALDGSGNVVVTGVSWGSGSGSDYYTAKYAAGDGALLWEKRYNGPANSDDYAQAVALDGSGNVVVTGDSSNGTNSDYCTVRYGAAVTAPTVVTTAATSVTATTATLNGTVNPNGVITSAWFEYGTTTSYGQTTTSQPQGYGTSASPVSAAITGLTPGTLYHYRLVAQNGETTAYGSDITFTTLTVQQGWRQQYFGTTSNTGNAADSFDFDKDGLENLIEWALGLNPTTASTLPVTTIRNGAFFEFTYTRSVAALNAGAVFTVEWSDTLPGTGWSNAGVTEQILSDNGTMQQVRASVPVGSQGRRFVHLKVTSPP
ncbi:MAG: choice-of-anchor D domain-containing protein [Verrucomicrobiaceae bacterium]|nr:choice-of-anchor D domain-containing protein [Verrucomicrobiaceae bacterium]